MNVVMRNWATSIPALGVMLVAIGHSLVAAFDGDPSTVVDANTIFVSVGFFFTSIVGLAARQAGNGSDSSLVSKYEAKGG